MFKRIVTVVGAFLLMAAPFSSAQAALLAKVEADVDGSGRKKMVELTGEKKMPGSNYYSDLWIMVKNAEGKMLTAWKANLDGGYYCLLEKMPVNAKAEQDNKKAKRKEKKEDAGKRFDNLLESLKEATGEITDKKNGKTKISDKPHDQILLMAAKGGRNAAVNCRILDFSDYKQVSFSGNAKNVLRLYNEDGSIAKPYLRPQVTEVASLAMLDGRLFTEQNVLSADGQELLGRLAVRWAQKEAKWIPEEINLTDTLDDLLKPDADSANRADGAGNWRLYPRRAFIGDRVISRPVVAVEEKPELQNKINDKLQAWFARAPEEDERAFQVKYAGSNLLSLELGRRNKKGEVIRELYNFNMQNGEHLKLDEMFNTKNPDFIKVINLVGKPDNCFSEAKPAFWHFTGKHFVLQDRLLEEGFQNEEAIHLAVVEKDDLLPFVKDKKILDE